MWFLIFKALQSPAIVWAPVRRNPRGNWDWCRLACLLALVGAAVTTFMYVPVTEWLVALSRWLSAQGADGAIVLCAVEVVWIVLCLPSTPLEMLIGSTYGFGVGFVIDTVGKSTGCMCAFVLGRRVGRGPVAEWLAKTQGGRAVQLLRALDVAIATQGWRIVLPFQLAWVPIALKNYGLSLCNISTRTFGWTMLVAELPMTAAVVYAGSTARSLVDLLEHKERPSHVAVAGVALGGVMLAITLVVVMRYVRQALLALESGEAVALSGGLHAYNRVAEATAAEGSAFDLEAGGNVYIDTDGDVGLTLTDYEDDGDSGAHTDGGEEARPGPPPRHIQTQHSYP